MSKPPTRRAFLAAAALATPALSWAQAPPAQDQPAQASGLPGPPEIPQVPLGPVLSTVPIRQGAVTPNLNVVASKPAPKDSEGIWMLDFAFMPVRVIQVEVPGKGRRPVYYLYYRIINNTGKPRTFIPQFSIVTDTGKRFEDTVLPKAVALIQATEDPTVPLRGAVDIVGILPPSGQKEGIEDAIYGVAVWEGVDPKVNAFNVYVRGLSNGIQVIAPPGGGAEQTHYKTLRIDFDRPGDDRQIHSRQIHLRDPAYEWIYW